MDGCHSRVALFNGVLVCSGGLRDFEKVRGAKGNDDTRCMAIAVKASHTVHTHTHTPSLSLSLHPWTLLSLSVQSVGISRGDIEQQLHAFKKGKLCGKELPNGDTKSVKERLSRAKTCVCVVFRYLVSAVREACGRYRLTYEDSY